MAEKKVPPHIKIARKAFLPVSDGGDIFWNRKRVFSEWEAWQWMIKEAGWKERVRVVGNSAIKLHRGEFISSVRFMAQAWGWKKSTASNFIKLLQDVGRIAGQRETAEGTVYLLVNYDGFQGGFDSERTESWTDDGQIVDKPWTQTRTNKKQYNKNNIDTSATDLLFDAIWHEYPRKVGKTKALQAWRKAIVRGDPKAIEAGIYRYTAYVNAMQTEQRFIKHLSTLINSGEWQDEYPIEGVVPIGKKQPQEWWELEEVV